MADRKQSYRERTESQETSGGASNLRHSGRAIRYHRGSRRGMARQAMYEAAIARVEARMPMLVAEFPELEMYRDHVNYLPAGKGWSATEIAGMHFLLDCYSRKGGHPGRIGMEEWATSKGLSRDYLYKLTRRDGFIRAYHRMGLVKVLLAAGKLDDRTVEQAMSSADPRWMEQAQRRVRAAVEGLGLEGKQQDGQSFTDADAVYRRTVTITEERRGPARPDPTMALPAQESDASSE